MEIFQIGATGSITLPPEICKKINAEPGTQVQIIVEGNSIVIKPVQLKRTAKIDLTRATDHFFKSGEYLFGNGE